MFLRFSLLALLVAAVTSEINCYREDSCFGEPSNCDPDTDCLTLFQFDDNGDLHMFLRNFTDTTGYAAFPLERHPDETIDYLICGPHSNEKYRVRTEVDGAVLTIDEKSYQPVHSFAPDYFRCDFNATDFPASFQQNQVFVVSRGSDDDFFFINGGVILHSLVLEPDFEYDDDEVIVVPTLYHLGSPVQHESMDNSLGSIARSTPESLSQAEMSFDNNKDRETSETDQNTQPMTSSSTNEMPTSTTTGFGRARSVRQAGLDLFQGVRVGPRKSNGGSSTKISLAVQLAFLAVMLKYIF